MELCFGVAKSVEKLLSIALQIVNLNSYLSLLFNTDNGDGGFLPGRSLSKNIIDQYATTKRNEITVAWSKSLDLTNSLVCTKVLFIITWISDATVVNFVALMMSSYINFRRCDFQQGHMRTWCHRQGCLLYRKWKKERKAENVRHLRIFFYTPVVIFSFTHTQRGFWWCLVNLRSHKSVTVLFVNNDNLLLWCTTL